MTKLLEQAVAPPKADQDSLAGRWITELVDEQEWQERFTGSQEILSRLAEEALAEHRAGLTEELDPDRL